ncbi:MAG: cold shock domain-containing protein [Anaerolineae bacterium]|nr:cold shock domain-containing protein [Anaerolineae bacterium]
MAQTENGTVKWFDSKKRFGFITRDDGGDAFLHANDMADPMARLPEETERLAFEIVDGDKGPAARNARRLSQ